MLAVGLLALDGGGTAVAKAGHATAAHRAHHKRHKRHRHARHVATAANNKGDVWTDNVGEPAGPGHEQDPHLACADINLWGNGLADSSGQYTIDGWPPSGSQEQVYASTWNYDGAKGGDQVLDVINVQKLVSTAIADGDAPVNKQGFHFKLQFVQGPQKHKTFWVNCKIQPAISVVKLERDGSSGNFVAGPITAKVGDTVNYEIQATNTGNTPLTLSLSDLRCDTGTIQGPTELTPTLNGQTLSAGGVAQYTCSHKITNADGDSFVNTATVVGQPPSGSPVSGQGTVVANITPNPGIKVTKLQRDANGSTGGFQHPDIPVKVGDTIQYQIQATNTGNQPLALSLNDPVCDGGTISGPTKVSGLLSNNTLGVGGVAQYTCTHNVTNSDPTPLTNVAIVTGTPPSGNPVSGKDQVNANIAQVPGLTVVKLERDGSAGDFVPGPIVGNVGDTINYEIVFTNTGNTTLGLSLSDPHCDAGTVQGPTKVYGTLSGTTLSQNSQAVYTCSHVLKSTDAPSFTNTATGTGTPPSGPPVTPPPSTVTTNIPAISVTKLQRDANGSTGGFQHPDISVTAGDTIQYEIQAKNTGGTPLDLSLNDPLCDAGTVSGPTQVSGSLSGTTLQPNGVAQYTCSHKLTAADPTNPFTNTATVTGKPPTGAPVSDTDKVNAKVNPAPAPGLTVVKLERDGSAGDFVAGPIVGNVGDTINYEILFTNTGNTALGLSLSDPHCDAGTVQGPTKVYGTLSGTTLSPNSQAAYTCSHVLKSADVPSFTNTATGTGTPPAGPPSTPPPSTVTTNIPAISVTKLQRDANGSTGDFQHPDISVTAGDTIQYEIQAKNTGGTPLDLSLNDPLCDAGTVSGPTQVSGSLSGTTLQPNGVAQYTCSHKLTSSDPTPFTNTAIVTGTPPAGTPVSGQDKVNANVTGPPPPPAPAISVKKLQRDPATGSFTHDVVQGNVGDTIAYEVQATNTGNVPLVLTLDDPRCDSGTVQGPTQVAGTLTGSTLSPGGEAQYTCSHTLTAADKTAQSFTNTATVTGTPPSGPPVSGTDQVTAKVPQTTGPQPAISVQKLQRDANGSTGPFQHPDISVPVGDTIQYEIVATNTGNVPLALSLDDPLCDGGTIQGPVKVTGALNAGKLAPAGVAQYTCSHVVKAGEGTLVTSGSGTKHRELTNTATVIGAPDTGNPVKGSDKVTALIPGTQCVSTASCSTTSLRVIKRQRIGNSGPFTRKRLRARPGRIIEYQLDVITGGNGALVLAISDPMCDAGTLSGPALVSGKLNHMTLTPVSGRGEVIFTCSHVLKATDGVVVTLGGRKVRLFTNVVDVTGTPPAGGTPHHGHSTVTLIVRRRPHPKPVIPYRPGKTGHGFTG